LKILILPEDLAFTGTQELAERLSRNDRSSSCVTKHFMTYAIGGIMRSSVDAQRAKHLAQETTAVGGSLKSMITKVIMSEPFRLR
jgi:hypothetical protein